MNLDARFGGNGGGKALLFFVPRLPRPSRHAAAVHIQMVRLPDVVDCHARK